MSLLKELQLRFSPAIKKAVGNKIDAEDSTLNDLLAMIRPAQDSRFGDYQANCAMKMAGLLGIPAAQVAQQLVTELCLDDLCQSVEIAGPGFINLRMRDIACQQRLLNSVVDPRLGVPVVSIPRRFVVDYSSPNVAKPMHVGHIRSTVIGDAIAKILRFVGHHVITDNHLGDWGTQFGMIIFGYKHFVNLDDYRSNPVGELARLYKLVRKLMDYQSAQQEIAAATEQLQQQLADLEKFNRLEKSADKAKKKQRAKERAVLNNKIADQQQRVAELQNKIQAVANDSELLELANQHPQIRNQVLQETSLLHADDPTNMKLWHEFLPHCRQDIQRIYQRLGIEFDHELGESFFHQMLQDVVDDFEAKGLARESEGAICLFLEGFDTPMIIQKKDGAFLYSTTDLATIEYRADSWDADTILYVVDHRQHEHFEKLFAAARLKGHQELELVHVSFGTVLGDDGKPYKTRSGDTVGLEGLLDEAERKAGEIARQQNPNLSQDQQQLISRTVGIGGLKYADLSQNRVSDYKFSYDKMLALKGNTSTYLQYSFARVQGILRKLEVDKEQLRSHADQLFWESEIERSLGIKILQFGEAIDEVLIEYKPNVLCNYLFELTQTFFRFYDQCSVKDAPSEQIKQSRLILCDLSARTIETGLGLLGIGVVEQM